jgi:cytochrome b subunit of formate dehydrogenase
MDSYHGLADGNGDTKVANCASCHGWHDVLPAADPRSRVNPANLAATCGQCHPNAGFALRGGKVHESLAGGGGASGLAGLLRLFYLILIPCVIGGMLFHNAADLLRKTLTAPRLPPLKDEGDELLLTVSERVQHAVLAASFFLLAFSGFALKFPRLWALTGLAKLGGETARLWTHRGAAVVFVALGAAHAAYLLLTDRGRERLRALLPAAKDIPEPFQLVLFNLGIAAERPRLSRWSYIEKSEYWALIWGSGVMVATGAVLIFHNFALAHFPLWVIESARVVHYMEAVLACLSILCWHGYWVVFDPDAYPMHWAWLTGRAKLERHEHKGDDSHG